MKRLTSRQVKLLINREIEVAYYTPMETLLNTVKFMSVFKAVNFALKLDKKQQLTENEYKEMLIQITENNWL